MNQTFHKIFINNINAFNEHSNLLNRENLFLYGENKNIYVYYG